MSDQAPGTDFAPRTMWIGEAQDHAQVTVERGPEPVVNRPPQVKEIVSGILALAARTGERIPLAKCHAIVHAMKSQEPILSGLRFSLTGDVCFSRDIDQAINILIDGGFLKIDGQSAVVTGRAHQFWRYLGGSLANSRIQDIHSVSLRFHDRLRRDVKNPCIS